MKFIVSTTTLLKSVQTVCNAFDSHSIPILRNLLFEVKEGEIRVLCVNRKTYMSTELKVETTACGCFAISPRILLDTLKCLPERQLTFKINKETFRVEIISEASCERLRGKNAKKLKKAISKRHPNALK